MLPQLYQAPFHRRKIASPSNLTGEFCGDFTGRYGDIGGTHEGKQGHVQCVKGAVDMSGLNYTCTRSTAFSPAPNFETLCRMRKPRSPMRVYKWHPFPIGGCPRVELAYGHLPETQDLDSAQVICDARLGRVSEEAFGCLANGSWSGRPPAHPCRPGQSLLHPPIIPQATRTGPGSKFGLLWEGETPAANAIRHAAASRMECLSLNAQAGTREWGRQVRAGLLGAGGLRRLRLRGRRPVRALQGPGGRAEGWGEAECPRPSLLCPPNLAAPLSEQSPCGC